MTIEERSSRFSSLAMPVRPKDLELLRCPLSGQDLHFSNGKLVTADGQRAFDISTSGIPLLTMPALASDAHEQQLHYDRIAGEYCDNLQYPHTIEYFSYLDRMLMDVVVSDDLGTVAELCCGRGEAGRLIGGRATRLIGIDISLRMLEEAQRDLGSRGTFVQGDATHLPLAAGSIDNVFILGGIHHVNDRKALFSEIFRVLKPGGYFYWREPVSDFFLWKWIRAVVYRVSPLLDSKTERPLVREETIPVLEQSGMMLDVWKTVGFIGFCLFMNSDVLVFNRLFRFMPGIKHITRWSCSVDDAMAKVPGLEHAGLIVVGRARKPSSHAPA